MNLTSFLTALFESGCVQVPAGGETSAETLRAAEQILTDFEREYRCSLPGEPPTFNMAIACQAAEALYGICRCLVYRELDPEKVLSRPELDRAENTATAHYSADVVLRFLPDAWRLVRAASESDTLAPRLVALGRRWPLSSIGIPGVWPARIDAIAADPTLLALYVDRVIERGDKDRLGDTRVRQAVLEALGGHPELAPELARSAGEPEQPASGL